jgi:cobalamin biosynthesis Co2+ chelatase CbiK
MLLTTTKKKLHKQFKKKCCLCGKQGHKSVDCYSRPENAHKKHGYKAAALTTTSSTPKADITCQYCHKKGHTEKQCFKKKREDKVKQVNVMLMALDHSLLSKGINTSFTSNTCIADSGATCHMRGSLEGMFMAQSQTICYQYHGW